MDQIQVRNCAPRLISLRAKILSQYPFFGRLLMRLSFGFSDCKTAYTDMRRVVFDPAFAYSLADDQLSFVMLHELMHCVLKHCTRGRGKLPLLYNIACDIVVNSILLEAMGVTEMKIGDCLAMHLTPKGDEGRLYSAEEVYEMLLHELDSDIPKTYGIFLFDCHDLWSAVALDDFMEGVWDEYTKDAARGVGHGSGIPASISRMVKSVEHKSKISWRQILQDYIKFSQSDYVFAPPDRRYSGDFLLPSFQPFACRMAIDRIWYAVDTSGSVSSSEISMAFSEIKEAIEQMDRMEGLISFFDCEVTDPIPFESVEDINSIVPLGGGGTSFKTVFGYLAEKMRENLPRVMVIITDGYSSFPEESAALGVPVIWLIINSEVTPPFGEVLHIYTNESEE